MKPSMLFVLVTYLCIIGTLVSGQFKQFNKLELPEGATGSQSAAFGGLDLVNNGPFTTVEDGRVLKWQGPTIGFVDFAYTSPQRTKQLCDGTKDPGMCEVCGRPLDLSYHPATELLYIADACLGLLAVGPLGGLATKLSTEFNFPVGVDVDLLTGNVYISDASLTYDISYFTNTGILDDSTGRLLRYEPLTRKVSVLQSGLSGASGPAVSSDGTFVLVHDSHNDMILKYWLAGPNANTLQTLIASDAVYLSFNMIKIKRAERSGEFWS